MLAAGVLLGRVKPSVITPVSLFIATLPTEITRIVVCNVSGSTSTFRFFHDDLAATFDDTTALYYDKPVLTGDSFDLASPAEGSGIQIGEGGEIQVRSSIINTLVFSIYGVTSNLAPRYGER